MIDELVNISPEAIKQIIRHSSSLAKYILESSKEQLGGGFPPGQRISIRRMVRIDQKYEIEETKRAFGILKRYFRIKYGRVLYEEHTNRFEMYFDIYFNTPVRERGIYKILLENNEKRRY